MWRKYIARGILVTLVAILAIGAAAPYLKIADRFRPQIQAGLEASLGRHVDVEQVRFNVFTGLGFTASRVTITEDPSFGIEPFAYVESLVARLRLVSLLQGKVEFSSLRLSAPSVNLVKNDAGVWNFQLFLNRGAGAMDGHRGSDFPAIEVRAGRLDFKFGDRKSVLYFDDADIDLFQGSQGHVVIHFAGEPRRTDRTAQSFGRLTGRGNWQPGRESQIDLDVELERTAISEVVRLVEGRDLGVHGIVSSTGRISGPMSNLQIAGHLNLEDIHRWDLMPPRGGGWQIDYEGSLDVWSQKLELASAGNGNPVAIKVAVRDYLASPAWSASAEVQKMPVATLVEVARHLGAPLPEKMTLDGSLSGVIGYGRPGGLQGKLALEDSTVQIPDTAPTHVARAQVTIADDTITLDQSTFEMGKTQTAEVEASYAMGSRALDLKISTKELNVSEMQSGTGRLLGAAAVPLLEACRQGTWRGWLRYQRSGDEEGKWTSQYDLQNINLDLPALADPFRLTSASVTSDGSRISVTRIRGRIGKITVDGDYHYDDRNPRPHHLQVVIPQADSNEIERLLAPSMHRIPQGFLARTLRFGKAGVPDWMKTWKLDGAVRIRELSAGDAQWTQASARVLWDGAVVRLVKVEAHAGDAIATGQITADIRSMPAAYHLAGTLKDLDYKGGKLDIEGSLDTSGLEASWGKNASGEGSFGGSLIAFNPESKFENISGCFQIAPGAQLHLHSMFASQGFDSYIGQGATQPDGRLLLELTTGGRQVKVMGSLFGTAIPR